MINLERSKSRLESIKSELERFNLKFERVPAVDGNLLDESNLSDFYNNSLNKRVYRRPLSRGEIGCYMSHIKCWKKIATENVSSALILEDDASLSDFVVDVLDQITNMEEKWDIIKLCVPPKKKAFFPKRTLSNGFILCRYKKIPSRTTGYLVTMQGAKKLLDARTFFGRPVDDDMQFYWEFDGKVLGVEPSVISCSEESNSSEIDFLGAKRGRKTLISQIKAPLLRLEYELKLRYHNSKYI